MNTGSRDESHSSDSYSDNESCEVNGLPTNCVSDSESDLFQRVKVRAELQLGVSQMTHKSWTQRASAFDDMSRILKTILVSDFLEEHKLAICEQLAISIRSRRYVEQMVAAELASLLSVQLAGDPVILKFVRYPLLDNVRNRSKMLEVRAKSCRCLALVQFLDRNTEYPKIMEVMHYLRDVFTDEETEATATDSFKQLRAASLLSWSLLFGRLEPKYIQIKLLPPITCLIDLVQSRHSVVRLAAGEMVALITEFLFDQCDNSHCKEHYLKLKDEFFDERFEVLIEAVKLLCNGSHKFRSRREKKTHKILFCDLLNLLKKECPLPQSVVRIWLWESLILKTWAKYHIYDIFCNLLEPGMLHHLRENNCIRGVLGLGPKVPMEKEWKRLRENQLKLRKELKVDSNANTVLESAEVNANQ